MAKIQFSEKALEHIHRNQVTGELTSGRTGWTWLMLFAITLFFGAVTFWGFFGTMTETVEGVGLTLYKGGLHSIVSPVSGTLGHLNVAPGSTVRAGQALGYVYSPEALFTVRRIEDEVVSLRNQIKEIESKIAKNKNLVENKSRAAILATYETKLSDLKQELDKKQMNLTYTRALYRENYWIHARFEGRVLEVLKQEGEYVNPGDKIGLIASVTDKSLFLVAFVSAEQGKMISNGMSAFFSPTSVSAAEFGYLKAVVRQISEVAVNPETVQSELLNTSLTKLVAGQSSVMRIVLELIPDSDSETGYRWTSKKGWPHPLAQGMLGRVIINTKFRYPASYVIPAIRELTNRGKLKVQ